MEAFYASCGAVEGNVWSNYVWEQLVPSEAMLEQMFEEALATNTLLFAEKPDQFRDPEGTLRRAARVRASGLSRCSCLVSSGKAHGRRPSPRDNVGDSIENLHNVDSVANSVASELGLTSPRYNRIPQVDFKPDLGKTNQAASDASAQPRYSIA
ncbi:hypothetical protein NDA10_004271 [Ustilago hordei]|nr:hypothetical protein NDA10_004271 [Ustilago hordei]